MSEPPEPRFGSHVEAWEHFRTRTAPLGSFLDMLDDDPKATVIVWIVVLNRRLAAAIGAIQRALEPISWLRPLPEHFLHVTLASSHYARPDGGSRLTGVRPFQMGLRRVGCFPVAPYVEAHGDGLREAAGRLGTPLSTYVPHASLAYTTAPGPVEPVRKALEPLREIELGEQLVDEILLCEVPASRTTILQPWRVLERVRLAGP